MSRRLLQAWLAVGLAVLAACPGAWAQGARKAPLTGQPLTTGPLITDTAVPIGAGIVSLQPLWFLSFSGGQFSPSWQRRSAGGDFVSLQILFNPAYGPSPNTEINLFVPYLQNWASNVDRPGPLGERAADFGGLGDTFITFKYRLVEEKVETLRPTVTGLLGVTFPTGHHRRLNPGRLGTDLLGAGVYSFTGGLNFSKWVAPVILYATCWYTLSTTGTVDRQRVHPRDLLTFNLAGEWVLTRNWVLLGELYSHWRSGTLLGPDSNLPAAARLGLVWGLEYIPSFNWNFALGVAIDLAGKNTPYNYTPIFTVIYNF